MLRDAPGDQPARKLRRGRRRLGKGCLRMAQRMKILTATAPVVDILHRHLTSDV